MAQQVHDLDRRGLPDPGPRPTVQLRRDERWIERRSTTYVSSYMTGYEDLDTYGEWRQEPDYGPLWFPSRVAATWAPYRYGHWGYVRPWGWTWIDDAPWGYAPFHYGRWVYVRNRWAWHPGERDVRPVWAPALVAWSAGRTSTCASRAVPRWAGTRSRRGIGTSPGSVRAPLT